MIVLNTSILLNSKSLVSNIFALLIFTFSLMEMRDIEKKNEFFLKYIFGTNLNF